MTKLSWADVERLADELAAQITASGYAPECLIGITTGGLVPLTLLAKKLGIKDVLTVSASSYDKDEQKEFRIRHLPEADLSGTKVLLVDEIADSGITLHKVAQSLKNHCRPAQLKTATLAVSESHCKNRPDFYAHIEKGDWVVFPWERAEFPEHFAD